MELLIQLLGFLQDPKLEVRQETIKLVVGLTKDDASVEYFRQPESKAIIQLQALCHDDISVAHDALKSLINIATDPSQCAPELFNPEFLVTLVKMATHSEFLLADLACMLMSNLSKDVRCVPVWLQSNDPTLKGLYMHQLVEVFCRGRSFNPKADFHFLASVFANLTRTNEGRCFFVTASEKRGVPLAKLLCFTEHAELIRRGGVISTIKNCCFDVSQHVMLMNEVDLLPSLLLPLAGPEELSEDDMQDMPGVLQYLEPTKEREKDPMLRRTLLEALLLLTTTREGREKMRRCKVYPIIRELHLAEDNETCDFLATELVQMLMRDEPEEGSGMMEKMKKHYDMEVLDEVEEEEEEEFGKIEVLA